MRRPAGADVRAEGEDPSSAWDRGEEVPFHSMAIESFGPGTMFVAEDGTYFTKKVNFAGVVRGVDIVGGEAHFRVLLLGTQSEDLLKKHTENPHETFQVHRCPPTCSQELVGDRVIHAVKVRKMLDARVEEGWVRNLEKPAIDVTGEDELAHLRARGDALREQPAGSQEKAKEKSKKKEKKEKEKKEKEKKKKKGKRKSKEVENEKAKAAESSSSTAKSLKNGNRSKSASVKDPQVLFRGTGLDMRDKVRSRVAKLARRHVRKKSAKDSSSSSESSGEEESQSRSSDKGQGTESIFAQTSKVRMLAENYPGALCAQALEKMREVLITEQGLEDSGNFLRPTALPYFRQQLQRRCTGPMQRELHTLATALDQLIRGRAACAADTLMQRMNRQGVREESTLKGRHGRSQRKRKEGSQESRRKRSERKSPSCRGREVRSLGDEEKTGAMPPVGDVPGADAPKEDGSSMGPNRGEAYQRGTPMAPQPSFHETMDAAATHLHLRRHLEEPPAEGPGSRAGEANSFPPPPPATAVEAVQTSSSGKKSWSSPELGGLSLGGFGHIMVGRLLEVLPLRRSTTGRGSGRSVFPLPTSKSILSSACPHLCDDALTWLQCMTLSLNDVWGDALHSDAPVNAAQRECLRTLAEDAGRFSSYDIVLEDLSWSEFLKVRSIDYKGDEVRVARRFRWANIAPALPKEIGKVPLSEVCTHGSKHYVEHFGDYLKDPSLWEIPQSPRVMVNDEDWPAVCKGLVDAGVCLYLRESEVFHVGGAPLLNGLFGVSKEEFDEDGVEIFRLIMNLIPLNQLCKPLAGDVGTLPTWSMMNPLFLQPTESLVISSEDVKCFFYVMSLPSEWYKFLAFNKTVPRECLPPELADETVYMAARVLPMGFLNSVSLAQHVHRNLASWARIDGVAGNPPEAELRKDRSYPQAPSTWRIYLDNYDLLEKVQSSGVVEIEGSIAPGHLALRHEYLQWEVPRNTKKSVTRSTFAEVQGACVDGSKGIAYPRGLKLARYMTLGYSLSKLKFASQKQWQVVCGGLVYFTSFRKSLLGCLNAVWSHIESYNTLGREVLATPDACRVELLRFLGMVPLARMNFRLDIHPMVTCSDASSTGGGICASTGLTQLGAMVETGCLRGEHSGPMPDCQVFAVGLFDGIAALRVALDLQSVHVLGYVSVEPHAPANRVVESHFAGVITIEKVELITAELVHQWSLDFSQAQLVVLGAGPPCQGVSGLNFDRKGALRDARSSLFFHVRRVRELLQRAFPWCPVHNLMESVASMDRGGRQVMSDDFGDLPVYIDAKHLSWCNRPRLYWCTWELLESEGAVQEEWQDGIQQWILTAEQPVAEVLKPGWIKVDPSSCFPTFTTSRPRSHPGRKPAGVSQCAPETLERWRSDEHRFPPYQYMVKHCVVNKFNEIRMPCVEEKEMAMGFPAHYIANCLPKGQRGTKEHSDTRLSLVGNSWSVPVIGWLLNQLLSQLGLVKPMSPQEIVDQCRPGGGAMIQARLQRLPLNIAKPAPGSSYRLARKLSNLISIKGEDILLTTPANQLVKYHRHRASVPSRLWVWKIVSGWRWRSPGEHINALELRAILTSLKWRVEHKLHHGRRFIHLTDSLVCLHSLTRGRSSLRQLTVQPATRKRYDKAVDGFLKFLQREGLSLPNNKSKLDPLVSDYLEELWSSGQGRALACDTLAGLQDQQPNLRNQLPGSWRLLKTWHVNEVPNRAPPLPEHVVQAMIGWALFHQHHSFAVSLFVGFYCVLRTGELIHLRASDIMTGGSHAPAVISLGFTKGGKRHGAAESVVLGHDVALRFVRQWKLVAPVSCLLTSSPAKWRS
eukprot:Skav201437  [mRNA]  locus=scaffold201:440319:446233:- [translate_table: standard]